MRGENIEEGRFWDDKF